jgi:hypothetical protein
VLCDQELGRVRVVDGDIGAVAAFGLMEQMVDSDRYLRLPTSAEELRRSRQIYLLVAVTATHG